MDDDMKDWDPSEAELDAIMRQLGVPPSLRRKRGRTSWTVWDLYWTGLPAPVWVVEHLLPLGLASLAGRPKVGKSLLALQLAVAVALDRGFLGYKVAQGPVLYLALEDPPQRLQERLQRQRVPESAPLHFFTAWPEPDTPRGLQELQQALSDFEPRLVVIDTLTQALDDLSQLAHQHSCCLLAVDHHKGHQGGDVIEDLLGPTAKAAALDTVWGLYGGRGQRGVSLRVIGRDVAPCELALRFDQRTQTWALGAEPYRTLQESALLEVARALEQLGGEATTSEIANLLGKPVSNVSRTLAALLRAGWVSRLPRQGHRVPYRLLPPAGRQ